MDLTVILKILRFLILALFIIFGLILIVLTKSNKKVEKKVKLDNSNIEKEKIKKEVESNNLPKNENLSFFKNNKSTTNRTKINYIYTKTEKEIKKEILYVYLNYFKIKEDYIEQDDKDIIKEVEKKVIPDAMYYINHKDITDDEILHNFIEYKMVKELENEYNIEFKKIPKKERRNTLIENKKKKKEKEFNSENNETKKEQETTPVIIKSGVPKKVITKEIEKEVINVEKEWYIDEDKLFIEDPKLVKKLEEIENKAISETEEKASYEDQLDVIEKYIEEIEKEYNDENIITLDDIEKKIKNIVQKEESIDLDKYPIPEFATLESDVNKQEELIVEVLPEKIGIIENKAIDKIKDEEEIIEEQTEKKEEQKESQKKEEPKKEDEDDKKEKKKDEEKNNVKIKFFKIEMEIRLLKEAIKHELKKEEIEDKNYDKIETRIVIALMKIKDLKKKKLDPKDRKKLEKYELKLINMKNQFNDNKQLDFINEEDELQESFTDDQIYTIEQEVQLLEQEYQLDLNEVGISNVEQLSNMQFKQAKIIEQQLINKNLKRANRCAKLANFLSLPFLKNRFFSRLASGILVHKSLNYIDNVLTHKTKEVEFDVDSIHNGYDALNGAMNMNSKNILLLNELEQKTYRKHPELENSVEFKIRVNDLKSSLLKREKRLIKKQNFIKKQNLRTKSKQRVLKK